MTATVWWAVAFYIMTFQHDVARFYEPNILIAGTEFVLTIFGMIAIFTNFVLYIQKQS